MGGASGPGPLTLGTSRGGTYADGVPPPSFPDALRAGALVLDGGLATELERQGQDLGSELWSARVLAEDPAAVVAAHRTFFAAGAQVATSASYQVSAEGFARVGQDGLAVSRLLRRSVRLAREAADEVEGGGWGAASVGP